MKTKSTDYSSPRLDVQLLETERGFASSKVGGIDNLNEDGTSSSYIWN